LIRRLALVLALVFATTTSAAAEERAEVPMYGLRSTPEEQELWSMIFAGKFVDARERAEAVLAANPDSYVAHLALAHVHHQGEANFPKALRHVKEARRLYEARELSRDPFTNRWHILILAEQASAHYELGQHAERLAVMRELEELHGVGRRSERAWSLMKLGEVEQAREAVREALASGDPHEEEVALNAQCAIEFEAGDEEASYLACKEAVEARRRRGAMPLLVDLTNFAEAARALFRFEETEAALVEAARIREPSYGNPHRDLADLYLRSGRFTEAAAAVKRIPEVRNLRPASMVDSDRAEILRTASALFILGGRPEDALRMTEEALRRPDRRSHQSRDPAQDVAVAALLDRQARLAVAERIVEDAVPEGIFGRLWARVRAVFHRVLAYRSGRRVVDALAGEDRVVGFLRIDSAKAAIVPPWLVGDLVDLVGSGVARAAAGKAEAADRREGIRAYLDAFRAEAAYAERDVDGFEEFARRALEDLPRGERMLRARLLGERAVLHCASKVDARCTHDLASVMEIDPGLFRRLRVGIPVRLEVDAGGRALAEILERSPRFHVRGDGLVLRVTGPASACLTTADGQIFECVEAEDPASAARAFQERVFSPRVELSRVDLDSLDGGGGAGRDPLAPLIDADL
jgi:tetratricopeptide (TPR) repeat protein